MKESIKYIIWYLLVYIVLTLLYGLTQKHYICTDMAGYVCNFDENKLISFLTITAYIITPAVAICGFQGWKKQENRMLQAKEAKELQLLFANEVEALAKITLYVSKIDEEKNLDEQIDLFENFKKITEEVTNNRAELAKKVSLFYELTDDLKIKEEAHAVVNAITASVNSLINPLKELDIKTAKENIKDIEQTNIKARKYRMNLMKYIKHT